MEDIYPGARPIILLELWFSTSASTQPNQDHSGAEVQPSPDSQEGALVQQAFHSPHGEGCWELMDSVAAIKGWGPPSTRVPLQEPASALGKRTLHSLSQACSMLGQTAQLQRPPVNRKDHSNANTAWPGLCGVTPPKGSLAERWANTHSPQRRLGRPRKEK